MKKCGECGELTIPEKADETEMSRVEEIANLKRKLERELEELVFFFKYEYSIRGGLPVVKPGRTIQELAEEMYDVGLRARRKDDRVYNQVDLHADDLGKDGKPSWKNVERWDMHYIHAK